MRLGLCCLLAALVNQRAVELAWPALASRLPIAIGLNLVMATAAWMRGSVTSSGALAGAMIGAIVYAGAGLPGWTMLLTAFVAAVGASKLGRRRQIARGIAEDQGDRRGAGNVLANCVVGAIGAWMMTVETADAHGALVLAAGLTAGASDTVASEIGKAFGGSPRAFPSFRHVPPGTPGAVCADRHGRRLHRRTADGDAGGGDSAGRRAVMLPGVVVGATIGAFVESALATRFEPEGVLNNDVLNFINTAVAAVVAVAATAVAAVVAVATIAGALQLLDRV